MRTSTVTASAILLSLAAAPVAAAHPGADGRTELLQAEQRLAQRLATAGPVQGLASFLAPDASYLHPGLEVITGRAAIRDALEALFPSPSAVNIGLYPIGGDVSDDGRLGFTFGSFDQTDSTTGTPVTTYGRYLATWRRASGRWEVQALLRLSASGPAEQPPADALILDGARGQVMPGSVADLRIQVMRADADFAQLSVDQGYTVAFSTYTHDAAVLIGSPFYWNRAGVEAAWAGWTPAETLGWYPLRAEVAGSGDLGWSIGYARYTLDTGSQVLSGYSKYLTLWIRAADGSWRFLADGGNGRPRP